jgi:hypothetical protein
MPAEPDAAAITSVAGYRRNRLIGFICIHHYRIVTPEFIAARGKPDTRDA